MTYNPSYFGKNYVQLTWQTVQNTVICNCSVAACRIKIRTRVLPGIQPNSVFCVVAACRIKIRTRVRDMRRKIMNSPNMLNSCLNQKISPNGENGCQNPKCHGRRLAASCCPEGIATRRVTRGIRCSVRRQVVWIRRFSGIGPVPSKYKCQVDLQLRLRHAPLACPGRFGRD